jgi:hypothetical protein
MLGTIGEWLGFGAGSVAATAAGAVAVTAVLGIATYGAATYLGSHSGETPTELGPAARGRQLPRDGQEGSNPGGPQPPAGPGATAAAGGYYVVRPNGSSILSVRSAAAIAQGIPWRSFRHGGTSGEKAPLNKLHGPYPTPEAATRQLAALVQRGTLRRTPLAAGFQARDASGGGWVTVDDMGAVEMAVLRE